MQIHINRDGQQFGPYPIEQVHSMLSQGQLLPTDSAWHEGMAAWKPLGQVVGGAGPVPITMGAPAGGGAWTVGGCIGDGFEAFKANMGGCVLFILVSYFVMVVAACIPLVNLFLIGPLVGGFLLFFIRQVRRQPNAVGDIFAGFSLAYGQLMLLFVVTSVFMVLATLPGILVMVLGAGSFMASIGDSLKEIAAKREFVFPVLGGGSLIMVLFGFLLIFLGTVYLQVRLAFAFPLVVDKGMGFWEAMGASSAKVKGQWFKVFGLVFVAQLIGGLGQAVFCVGVLFTMPICMCSIASCYVRNFD